MSSTRKEVTSELPPVTVKDGEFDPSSVGPVMNGDTIPFDNVSDSTVLILDEEGVFGDAKATIPLPPGTTPLTVIAPDDGNPYFVTDESGSKRGDTPMPLKITMGNKGGRKHHPRHG